MSTRTVSYVFTRRRRNNEEIPFIRLSGRWLQRLGFRSGGRYTLRVDHRTLILTPTDENAS